MGVDYIKYVTVTFKISSIKTLLFKVIQGNIIN